MQEHIHVAKKSRIINQSLFIWVSVIVQIGFNIFTFSMDLTSDRIAALIFCNIILSLLSIPAIILFLKYYKHSIGKKFVITYNSLKFIDEKTGEITELKNADIERINLVANRTASKLPWSSHEYFEFIDSKQNKIIVTSYFMDISDFWLDSLTRRVSTDNLIHEEKIYPIF